MKKVLIVILGTLLSMQGYSQVSVFDPNDPIIEYDENNPPSLPLKGTVAKWVRTQRVSWNTSDYKSYFYNGMPFRLLFPKNYDPSGNTKYPLVVMMHGRGQAGSVYDNENSLGTAARHHMKAVNDGDYDGFVMFGQNRGGFWGDGYFTAINDLIVNHFPALNVDPDRVIVHGLSAGGQGIWNFMAKYPNTVAAALPMAAASTNYFAHVNQYKHIPIWLSQGGKDSAPSPYTAKILVDSIEAVGGNIRYTLYHNLGHGVWGTHYAENDFWPYINHAHKTNPVVLNGELTRIASNSTKDVYEFLTQEELCAEDPIEVKLGISDGFENYEWRIDGNVIAGENTNEITATSYGTYDVRFMRAGVWTDWSNTPVEIKLKDATVTPDITVSGLMSKVIPSPDGNTSVDLELPEGYIAYDWRLEGTSETLTDSRIFSVATPGDYVSRVTEKFGCSSEFSSSFKVVDSQGVGSPDPLTGFAVFALSNTELKLQWTDTPSPSFDETAFEVYKTQYSGGNYELLAIVDANTYEYTDSQLIPDTEYYYIVRPVNENGAAAVSNELSAITEIDVIDPEAPLNLTVIGQSDNQIELIWSQSKDDIGVFKYDIYKNGVKTLATSDTSAIVYNLVEGEYYQFQVKSRDYVGNVSPFSNLVVAQALSSGLTYRFYRNIDWSLLPDFNSVSPTEIGKSANFDISQSPANDYFGYYWEGEINIPVAGNYTFETRSDDGSQLFIGGYDANNLVVDNDGLHGMRDREGTYNFPTAGSYPITVTFFERNGGEGLEVYWKNTAHGVTNRELIPDSAFEKEGTAPGNLPEFPTNLTATSVSYDTINLTWTDNSSIETGYQIFRSETSVGDYLPVGSTNPNVTSFSDTNVKAATKYDYYVIALGQYGTSEQPQYLTELVGDIDYGVSVYDNAEGTGYLMYTREEVTSRFSNRLPHGSNADHLIAVKEVNGTWYYDDNNSTLEILTPAAGDVLLAAIDFDNDAASSLQGIEGSVNGISSGFSSGDLKFFANQWNGFNNNGEFDVEGSYFIRYMDGIVATAITGHLPPAPSAAVLSIASSGLNSVEIDITDSETAVDNYKIYRSVTFGGIYLPVAELSNTDQTYSDEGLLTHTDYYYYIVSLNAGGETLSDTISAATLNSIPTIDDINNVLMRHGSVEHLQLYASDADNDQITLSVTNLPDFATFTDYGDGSVLIEVSPLEVHIGTYSGIEISIADNFGGLTSTSFTLNVTDNFAPTLDAIADISTDEGLAVSSTLQAQDIEGNDQLTWTLDAPDFVSLEAHIDGSAELTLDPYYTHAGSYLTSVTVTDIDAASETQFFTITVNDVNPNTFVQINFTEGAYNGPANWNNTTGHPFQGNTYDNLMDSNGANTAFGIEIVSVWNSNGSNTLGKITGDDSGVYPDNVLRTSYWTQNDTQEIDIVGLDDSKKYSLTFLGSRNATNDRSTAYESNGQSVILDAASNTSETVTLSDLTASNGVLTFTVKKAGTSSYGYLNSLVIEEIFSDGLPPASASNLLASFDEVTNSVNLSWTDHAFNEVGYQVFRANSLEGAYDLIATLPNSNAANYVDNDILANHVYYYTVNSYNQDGSSESMEAVEITIPNIAPFLNPIEDILTTTGQETTISISATDSDGDILSLYSNSLPAFCTLIDNTDGTAALTISPNAGDMGSYSTSIIAEDNYGAMNEVNFIILIEPSGLSNYYVNFAGSATYSEVSPWNNYLQSGESGSSIDNLSDESGTSSTISIEFLDSWNGYNTSGVTNSTIFPTNVSTTALWDQSTADNKILISGLALNKAYDFTFYSSRSGGGSRTTDYTIDGQTVSLNAAYNTDNTASITGLLADANGEILITAKKQASSSYAYLNAIVISEYAGNALPATPTDLEAKGLNATEIQLNWSDNSIDEIGYEVWRSENNGSTYSLLSSISINAVSHIDNGLTQGVTYYYKVRAILGSSTYTDFSGYSASSTLNSSISINFNADTPASAPWNNTNSAPDAGKVFGGLLNSEGNPTGVSLEIVAENPEFDPSLFGFNGNNPFGMNTGNNSGIVPDNVMRSTFWMDPGKTAQLKLFGLDISQKYDVTFFASRDGGGDRTTVFTINNVSAKLNAAYNTNNVAIVNNILADENGEILISITSDIYASYSYLGGMIIEGSNIVESSARFSSQNNIENNIEQITTESIYPNPLTNGHQLNVQLIDNQDETIEVKIISLSGNVLFSQIYNNLSVNDNITIDMDSGQIKQGVYVLQLVGAEIGVHTKKFIKN